MGEGLVLRHARIAGAGREPVDLRVAGGMIAELGDSSAGALRLGSSAQVVDLAGRWVLPGLADRHVHLLQWAKASRRLDLAAARSAADAAELVGTAVAAGAEEVVGYGFRDGLWPDLPLVVLLDRVAGERPVVLVSGDLHCAWLNSAALRRHGLPATDGLVRERAAFDVLAALDQVDDAAADRWVLDALAQAARRGITRLTDMEMCWSFADWPRRAGAGPLPVRIDAGFYSCDLDRAIEAGMRTGDVVDGTAGRVHVGPLKVITDGSLNTRTAWCVDPYPGLAGDHAHGVASVGEDELRRLLARATAAGLAVAVHAIGDRANQSALDAFGVTGARGSIEHAQLVRVEDIGRFTALGVAASVQPEHAMDDRDVAERYWPGRTDRAFVLRSLHEAGATLWLGSDAPVAPLDPWVALDAAVNRARDGRAPWHPEQALDVGTAIAASTPGRAVLAVGSVADLVVVDRDPYDRDLRDMPVHATMLDGEWTAGPN